MSKRIFDVTLTIVTLPLTATLCLAMAIALAIELRGTPIFIQTRIGLHGRPFRMYKLRTMRHAAPGEAPCYRVDDWDTFVFSPSGVRDPRLTRLGALARKTSIDELPNLINVLKGEMSIVGPRPEIPEIVVQYPAAYHRRHDVLPGIAGLAQVKGRSDLTYAETVRHDLDYVDRHSLLGDVHILIEALRVVVRGAGAR
jgi:lipopolysaccharide/colanic/teichoic acid biosynthesis glycosyltransferase